MSPVNNYNGILLPEGSVRRDYTPAVLLVDMTFKEGFVPKGNDVCLLTLGPGYDGKSGDYAYAIARVYFPGGVGIHALLKDIPARNISIPYFMDYWGNEHRDVNGEELFRYTTYRSNRDGGSKIISLRGEIS